MQSESQVCFFCCAFVAQGPAPRNLHVYRSKSLEPSRIWNASCELLRQSRSYCKKLVEKAVSGQVLVHIRKPMGVVGKERGLWWVGG